MIPALQTIYGEIIQEMFSSVVKTTNDIKIRGWRTKIGKLKDIDPFEYKLLSAILSAYVNNNDEGINIAESARALSNSVENHARIEEAIGNMLFHKGNFIEAMDSYWKAYDLTKDVGYFISFLATATNFATDDPRLELMKTINIEDRDSLNERLNMARYEQICLRKSGLDILVYRDVIKAAFTTFYLHCSGTLTRHPKYSDSNISTIIFNTELDVKTVGILNDHLSDKLVDLLEFHDFEELLKYPIIFTSEDYSAALNREIYCG